MIRFAPLQQKKGSSDKSESYAKCRRCNELPKNQTYCLKSGNQPTADRRAAPALRDSTHKKFASAPTNSPDF